MAEQLLFKRIQFPKQGTQRAFIVQAKVSLGITYAALAQKLYVSPRTITDWVREKYRIPYSVAQKISTWSHVPIPKNYKLITQKDHLQKIAPLGGKARIARYKKIALDEDYRSSKWKEWWETTGQYRKNPNGFQSLIPTKTPPLSESLAEFVGIMLGDGGIAPYHISITLSEKEKDYVNYIVKMIHKLFGVQAKVYKQKQSKAVSIVVQRKQIVDFCKSIGLVQGNKVRQQCDIPQWIKDDTTYSRTCIRGLIDTDGCFYTNSYKINRKKYTYLKICFTNFSSPLIKSVYKILQDFEISSYINKNGKDIRITNRLSVNRYISIIGSSNSKHIRKLFQ